MPSNANMLPILEWLCNNAGERNVDWRITTDTIVVNSYYYKVATGIIFDNAEDALAFKLAIPYA